MREKIMKEENFIRNFSNKNEVLYTTHNKAESKKLAQI